MSEKSSSNGSEEVPISPESKARSSSDSKVEVSEPRRSRSSRSRSSSVEIDENVHRNLEQQQDQPLSNGQGTFLLGFARQKDACISDNNWGKPEQAPHKQYSIACNIIIMCAMCTKYMLVSQSR